MGFGSIPTFSSPPGALKRGERIIYYYIIRFITYYIIFLTPFPPPLGVEHMCEHTCVRPTSFAVGKCCDLNVGGAGKIALAYEST